MGTWFRKLVASVLLAATSFAAFLLLWQSDNSLNGMFPALSEAKKTGQLPDGLAVRRAFTGYEAVDNVLTGLATCFGILVDGRDKTTYLFALWFLPQLSPLVVNMIWESGRRRSPFMRLPVIFGVALQLFAAGVILPVYYTLSIITASAIPKRQRGNAVAKARALLPAILFGYFLPSAALFFAPPSVPLDVKQFIAAVWQPFPVWVSSIYMLFRFLSPAHRTEPDVQARVALTWITRVYAMCGLASAAAHIWVLYQTIYVDKSPESLIKIFVPHTLLHYLSYLPVQLKVQDDVDPYRRAVRQFFQFDWFTTITSAFIYFGWSTFATAGPAKKAMGIVGWFVRVAVLTVLGGPGAALAWAAISREERVFARQRAKLLKAE